MDVDEAVQDAIETSKMQGGNLFFIIKKNVESDGRHKILHLLDDLLVNPSDSTLEAFRQEAETFELGLLTLLKLIFICNRNQTATL